MNDPIIHNDSWVNLTTGIGGPKDKSSGFAFHPSFVGWDWATLENLYEEEHLCAAIIDSLPEATFSRGWQLELSDQEQKETIIDALDALDAEGSIQQAMCYERLHGGAAIFVGVDDGSMRFDEPLRPEMVRSVLYLHVFDRWELTPARMYMDPKSPKFGKPSHYRVHPTEAGIGQTVGVIVHESRLIIFEGEQTTKRKRVENQGWGQSVLARVYTAVKQYGGAMASVLALMADASQGVYKIKGLLDIIRSGNSETLFTRMAVMERMRSSLNAILLDADGEDYVRIASTLTELGNLIDRFQAQVASAAKMPITEIFGRSPAGMNATGESDIRTWYDKVAKIQRKKARPALDRILRLLFASTLGPTAGQEPESWAVKFSSPWQPTAKENAEILKIKTETAAIAYDIGAVTTEQVARGLFSGSEWDGGIVLDAKEIEALKAGVTPSAPGDAELLTAPLSTQDDETEEGEELSHANPRELAAKMTELGIPRCEHGKVNRCQMCGIERHRDVEVAKDGTAQWALKWRAIGERIPVPTEPDDPSDPARQ